MKVAILGAGPIGLEAALAATARGHDVVVFERGERVASAVRMWGHVKLFTPWHMNTTPAGRAAVDGDGLQSDALCAGETYAERYLDRIAMQLDVRLEHEVIGIARQGSSKSRDLGQASRAQTPFRLLVRTPTGAIIYLAEAVLDCTGTLGDPAPVGAGGLEAPGEREALERGLLRHGPVPVTDLAGLRVLVVGNGATAATQARDLLALHPPAQLTWLTHEREVPGFHSPEDDPLAARRALATAARDAASRCHHVYGVWIDVIDLHGDELTVHFSDGRTEQVDHIVGCTGFRPNHQLTRELQVHVCWGTEGPMKLAAALLAQSGAGADCLQDPQTSAEALRSPEPRYFMLGSKSYGRRSDFLLQRGHAQIDEVLDMLDASPGPTG